MLDAGAVAEFDHPHVLLQKEGGIFKGLVEEQEKIVEIYEIEQCDKCSKLVKLDKFGYQIGYDRTEKVIWFCGACR